MSDLIGYKLWPICMDGTFCKVPKRMFMKVFSLMYKCSRCTSRNQAEQILKKIIIIWNTKKHSAKNVLTYYQWSWLLDGINLLIFLISS